MANSKVWSSCALTKEATPMTPSAPGRFSTMTGCAHRTDKRSAKSLAVKSEALPAGTGKIRRTVRSGQAAAEPQKAQHAARATMKIENTLYMRFPHFLTSFSFTPPCPGTDVFLVGCHDLEHEFNEDFAVCWPQTSKQFVLARQC